MIIPAIVGGIVCLGASSTVCVKCINKRQARKKAKQRAKSRRIVPSPFDDVPSRYQNNLPFQFVSRSRPTYYRLKRARQTASSDRCVSDISLESRALLLTPPAYSSYLPTRFSELPAYSVKA
jgi:hypothetical protein